jgi:hypothetical protein
MVYAPANSIPIPFQSSCCFKIRKRDGRRRSFVQAKKMEAADGKEIGTHTSPRAMQG